MNTRKVTLLTLSALVIATVLGAAGSSSAAPPGGTLDISAVPKFVTPLVIPPVMPPAGKSPNYYEIEVVQFEQQVLPATLPKTTVWSYGAVGRPETRSYPAFTIESKKDAPIRVKWINNLVDADGNYLPHLLPIDQTLHWANPPQECRMGMKRTDCEGTSQELYTGPVPIITHLHGAHVQPDSDGFPTAWFLPAANNIPKGYATEGSMYSDIFNGSGKGKGFAVFQYPNDQPETTLWFHDHALGMTRANVYAGPAGFYLLRDPSLKLNLPGPAPRLGDRPGKKYYEIPIVIQDRSFNADGSLFYPDNRDFFEGLDSGTLAGLGIKFSPQGGSDVAPVWNPEFFGNTIVVNGKTWPKLKVEQRKYRFRLLNGSDSRFFILRFEGEKLSFTQIGADQGFLPAPVPLKRLLIGPAERADVIVDFSKMKAGTRIILENIGPDEPFGGGVPCVDGLNPDNGECGFAPSDPLATGVVMAFDVVKSTSVDSSRIPATLPAGNLGPVVSNNTRQVTLNEEESANQQACFSTVDGSLILTPGTANNPGACAAAGGALAPFGPTEAVLGTLNPDGTGNPLEFMDAVTENPALGGTETWEIYNLTADAHPIHVHLVRFRVMDRQSLETDADGVAVQPAALVPGTARPAESWESGFKDTVISYPGEVTRIQAQFDIPGLYVWHCHILSHEDNEMMRPFCVGAPEDCPMPIAAP